MTSPAAWMTRSPGTGQVVSSVPFWQRPPRRAPDPIEERQERALAEQQSRLDDLLASVTEAVDEWDRVHRQIQRRRGYPVADAVRVRGTHGDRT